MKKNDAIETLDLLLRKTEENGHTIALIYPDEGGDFIRGYVAGQIDALRLALDHIIDIEESEKMETEIEWLTPKEAAKYLGISLSQVYSYMRHYPPPWPFYQVTATRRLTKRADLDTWLEKVKVSAVKPDISQEEGGHL